MRVCMCVCSCVCMLSRKAELYCFILKIHNIFYAVNSNPGVDGVDLLCRLLINHGSRQHRTIAMRIPNSVVMRPEKINKNLY